MSQTKLDQTEAVLLTKIFIARGRLERVAAAYERERRASGLPATWEVIYGASWGAAGRQAVSAPSGIAHIAPGSIRRSRR